MLLNTKILSYLQDRNRGKIIGLLLAVFIIYLPFINNALFFDDLPFFSRTVIDYAQSPPSFNLRWLPYASIGWTWKAFGDTPLPLHLGNLLLHAANTLLMFILLQQLSTLILNKNRQTANQTALPPFFLDPASWNAWLGALCFACHPVAVYATGYVVQRTILMATLFTLSMQLAYLQGLVSNKKHQQIGWLLLSIIFYFLAVFSKEHSLTALAVVIAMTILLRPYINANWRYTAATWLGFIAVAALVILKAKGVFGAAYEHDAAALFEQQGIVNTSQNLHLLSIFTQAGLFFKYLFLWLLPNTAWMSVDMRETFSGAVVVWQNWLKVACFIVYGLITLKLLFHKGKIGLLGFALICPWLMFVVEFASVRVQEPFVLYRSYLWMPGLLLLIPIALDSLTSLNITKKTINIVAFTIILTLVPLSWNRLWIFADGYRLWNDAALLLKNDTVPGAARIFYNRGNFEFNSNKPEKAVLDFKRVIAIDPTIYQAHENLGYAYLATGQLALGVASLNQAIAIFPENGQAYLAKALALKRLNNKAAANEALIKSCALKNVSACLILSLNQKNN